MAVTAARDVDQLRVDLQGWLSEHLGGRPVEVGSIDIPGLTGFSNETLLVDATWDGEPHPLVVRVEPTAHQVFPATSFDAQVEVLRALGAEGSVPVPEVLWFETDPALLGARFFVMPRIDGQVPADNPSYHAEGWVPALAPGQRERLWLAGLDAMAAVHNVDRDAAGLGWIDAPDPAAILVATREYVGFAHGGEVPPLLATTLDALGDRVPPAPEAPALCWGDSRLGNLLFRPDQSVAAVLDWEMVTAGDPLQDLAWFLLVDRHHHEAFGVPRLTGLPDREATIRHWEQASGRSAGHLPWYELLAAVRYAAILTRVLLLLEDTGILPGASAMAGDHTGTQLLERLLAEEGT